MSTHTLILFALTVLPLICTPGPDMLFIASQSIAGSATAGLRATAGVCSGYLVHSLMVAVGLAAVIAASPVMFATLRWAGVAYLAFLALQLLRSALTPGQPRIASRREPSPFHRGFLTAAMNPKGMLIYFAIIPQFMQHDGSIALQAIVLSGIFIGLCGVVYAALSFVLAATGSRGSISDGRRRWVEGVSGGMLAVAATRLASS
ncbi:LysE family translocator [Pinirhizobacter sp.]|jgi:threonine/homoserine/homoserine lactone efflux protein|uniref:LysE family translocator n=1 Tax=Pinirhizobacter sp. TaxID=2950432 RepID=UPI002F3E2AC0